MCYPDWRMSQAIIETRLAEARAAAASEDPLRRAQPMSARRLQLLSRMSRGLVSVGRRITQAGLALQTPDLAQPSL
jgi:hypothetical protein